jgi:hypothetical protein
MRSNTVAKPVAWGALALFTAGLAACSPASSTGASSATSAPASAAGDQEAGDTGPTTTVAWRGAEVRVPAGWQKAGSADDFLCVLPAGTAKTVCSSPGHDANGVQNFLFMYASERKANKEAPADPKTLDGSDMNFWMYNGGEVPCDEWSKNEKVDGATKMIGGLQAFYGRWSVTCKSDGKSFVAQRWLLPKSRFGVVSYALTDQRADEILQMISTMDMAGYETSDTPTG